MGPGTRTSTPHAAHRIYPYPLKGKVIDRPDRVWCADITYIAVQRGFLYLVAISMDGRGRCLDNIFTERLWRSLKYEAVYLYELTDGFRAEQVIGEWIGFYNAGRPTPPLKAKRRPRLTGPGGP